MNVFFVRHGLTEWNLQGRAQGLEDIELNEGGMKQAVFCGEALRDFEPIDCIVTSPLKRARVTAEHIAQYHRNVPFLVINDFTERDLGLLSGKTGAEMDDIRKSGIDTRTESRPDVAKRAMKALAVLEKDFPNGNVFIITHGGVITSVLQFLEYEGVGHIFLDNVFVTEISYVHGKCDVLRCNISPDRLRESFSDS